MEQRPASGRTWQDAVRDAGWLPPAPAVELAQPPPPALLPPAVWRAHAYAPPPVAPAAAAAATAAPSAAAPGGGAEGDCGAAARAAAEVDALRRSVRDRDDALRRIRGAYEEELRADLCRAERARAAEHAQERDELRCEVDRLRAQLRRRRRDTDALLALVRGAGVPGYCAAVRLRAGPAAGAAAR